MTFTLAFNACAVVASYVSGLAVKKPSWS